MIHYIDKAIVEGNHNRNWIRARFFWVKTVNCFLAVCCLFRRLRGKKGYRVKIL